MSAPLLAYRSIVALARTTLHEAIRDRILYGVLGFGIALILLSTILSEISQGQPIRIVTNVALSAVTVGGALMALLLGSGAISREIERRTVYPILAKPISRVSYVLGKYCGVVGTVWLNVALMLAAATAVIAQYAHGGFAWPVPDYLLVLGLALLRLALIAAIAVAFSTIASNTVSLLASGGLVLAGHLTADVRAVLEKSDSEVNRQLGAWLYYLVPDLQALDPLPLLLHRHPIATPGLAFAAGYAVCYAAAALLLATVLFARRDLP